MAARVASAPRGVQLARRGSRSSFSTALASLARVAGARVRREETVQWHVEMPRTLALAAEVDDVVL
jgi:hypothetical protein